MFSQLAHPAHWISIYPIKRKGAKEQREDGEEITKWRANIEMDECENQIKNEGQERTET